MQVKKSLEREYRVHEVKSKEYRHDRKLEVKLRSEEGVLREIIGSIIPYIGR